MLGVVVIVSNVNCRYWLITVGILLLMSACEKQVGVSGQVKDIQGNTLPAVAVTVENTGDQLQPGDPVQTVTNGVGRYKLRCLPGRVNLNFVKTGYTTGRMTVNTDKNRTLELRDMVLWPMPALKGVYRFDNFRYEAATATEPEQYRHKDGRLVFGTKIPPQLVVPAPAEVDGMMQWPVLLMAYKLPPYDAKLHRLEKSTVYPWRNDREASEQDIEEIAWIRGDAIKLMTAPVDKPQRLLLELQPVRLLEPGRYAVHWGALEGYEEIDGRIFIFEVAEPETEPEADAETETAPEE